MLHIVNIDMVELTDIGINRVQEGKELIPVQNDITINDWKQAVLDSRGHLVIVIAIKIFEHGFEHFIIVDFTKRVFGDKCDLEG